MMTVNDRRCFRQAVSHFATVGHDLHRRRRGAMGKFFSRGQVLRLEPKIERMVQRLCDKLLLCGSDDKEGRGEPFNVADAYSCFASDLAAEYAFGEPFGFLEQDGWLPNFRAATYAALNVTYLFRFFPWLKGLVDVGPW